LYLGPGSGYLGLLFWLKASGLDHKRRINQYAVASRKYFFMIIPGPVLEL
jgi:hypothetical protein